MVKKQNIFCWKKITTFLIDQTFCSTQSPHSAIVFKVFLQKSLVYANLLDWSDQWILSKNQVKGHCDLKEMSKKLFLHVVCRAVIFFIAVIIIPSKSENVNSLTHILFQALFTSYQVNQAFVIAVKFMIYFGYFMGHHG